MARVRPPLVRPTLVVHPALLVLACGRDDAPTAVARRGGALRLARRHALVTNHDHAGPGSLRQAIEDAQSGDVITFDPSLADESTSGSTRST